MLSSIIASPYEVGLRSIPALRMFCQILYHDGCGLPTHDVLEDSSVSPTSEMNGCGTIHPLPYNLLTSIRSTIAFSHHDSTIPNQEDLSSAHQARHGSQVFILSRGSRRSAEAQWLWHLTSCYAST
jgi:hypothetical protein